MTGWATYRTLVFLKEYWGSFDGWVGLLGIGWALNEYPDKAYMLLCCAKRRLLMHMNIYLVQLSWQILRYSGSFALPLQAESKQLTKRMMKRVMSMLACLVMAVSSMMAQSDKILGNYSVVRNGVSSKVKVFKHGDGFRAQVTWVDNLKKEDGTLRTDEKNPDKSKRSVRADQIVLIDKVTYDAKNNVWTNGKIYDPTKGKTYKVKLWFDGDKVLKMRGYIGPLFDTSEWKKID